MDEADSRPAQGAGKLPDGRQDRGGFEGTSPATPRSNAGGLEPRAQRPFGAEAAHVHVPPRSVQPGRDLDKLPLRPAAVEGVAHEQNRRARVTPRGIAREPAGGWPGDAWIGLERDVGPHLFLNWAQ